jgi:hypothetical protein
MLTKDDNTLPVVRIFTSLTLSLLYPFNNPAVVEPPYSLH